MLGYIMEGVKDHSDDAEIAAFLRRILRKEAGDGSGLIYGMGHAVYTKSDPRAVILRRNAEHLAVEKGFEDEFRVLCAVERLGPGRGARGKGHKGRVRQCGPVFRPDLPDAGHQRGSVHAAVCHQPHSRLAARTAWRRSCLQTASCARLTNIWGMSRNIYR